MHEQVQQRLETQGDNLSVLKRKHCPGVCCVQLETAKEGDV